MRTLLANVEKWNKGETACCLLEMEESSELVLELTERVKLQKIFVFSTDEQVLKKIQERMGQNRTVIFEYKRLDAVSDEPSQFMKSNASPDYLFFDEKTDKELIQQAVGYWKPLALYGTVWENKNFLFQLWEVAKDISEHIFLQSKRLRVADVIDWTRGESDVLLSIVFPVYNVSKYLEKCIQSVTAWKAPYVEFLFVNDGSKDESPQIIEECSKTDSRIKLINKENGGCASARKFGLEKARGLYVGFVDPDDFVDETMFQKLLSAAFVGGFDFSYCGFNYYYETSGVVESVSDALDGDYVIGTYDRKLIDNLICWLRVGIWRGIYKRSVLEKNHISFYTDLRRFDDLPFKVETLTRIKSCVAVPEHLYYYRLERPGQDVACRDDRLYVHFPIFEHLDAFILPTRNQRHIDMLQVVRAQTHFYALEKIEPEFAAEYSRQAKIDMLKNGDAKRTEKLIRDYASKEYAKRWRKMAK